MPSADDAERLAALERAVVDLQRDVRELRAALLAAPSTPLAGPTRPDAAAPEATRYAPPVPAYAPRPSLGARAAAYGRAQAAGLGIRIGTGAAEADVEALVGRYATVAVAALLILTGVGAFLTWAVNTFTITPAARVSLGVVLAVALGGFGWRLRGGSRLPPSHPDGDMDPDAASREGTRRFGDVLLALALAVAHVNAWAAGPYLGLVPPAAALAIAAAASVGLAGLALRAHQQSLFVIGVGGALVAPFVTASATGRPVALLAYGWVVLAAGLVALPADTLGAARWRAAVRLLALGAATYTVALLSDVLDDQAAGRALATTPALAFLWRAIPAALPLASAAVPLALASRRPPSPDTNRATLGGLSLAYCATAAGAIVALGIDVSRPDPGTVLLALLATLGTYASAALLDQSDSIDAPRRVWLPGTLIPATAAGGALLLPLVALAGALAALDRPNGARGATVASVWAALAALAAWHGIRRVHLARRARTVHASPDHLLAPDPIEHRRLTAAHLAVAGLASAFVPVLGLSDDDVLCVGLLAVHAAVAAQLFRLVRRPLTLLAPVLVGAGAAAWAAILLADRPAYRYVPFLTPESLVAGAVVVAWCTIAHRVWTDGTRVVSRTDRRLAVGTAASIALLWGHQELARAVSPDVSAFLLIGYFAVAGLGAIALGRARAVPAARQVGLALALYAALRAFVQTSAIDAIGLRVGSYLLVGGFLLAVGYWYRAAGSRAVAPPPVPDPAALPPTPAVDAR